MKCSTPLMGFATNPDPLSSIRTLTVGFGITPNLLTLIQKSGARGLEITRNTSVAGNLLPPVGNFTPP